MSDGDGGLALPGARLAGNAKYHASTDRQASRRAGLSENVSPTNSTARTHSPHSTSRTWQPSRSFAPSNSARDGLIFELTRLAGAPQQQPAATHIAAPNKVDRKK
jgi:hypothetical protein